MEILEGEGIEVAQARSLVRSALKARKGKHGGRKRLDSSGDISGGIDFLIDMAGFKFASTE